MNAALHARHPHSLSALSLLFARYVAGQITEPAWKQISSIFDAGLVSADERVAFASFISDACSELGPDSVKVPRPEEVEDVLTCTRV